jgi:hypothetical protein
MCTFCVRSKDAGAYDMGELDQALFLYLDGQDPSTVNQDQRRELSLSLSLSKLKKISSFSFSLHYSFSFPPLLFLLGDSLWKGLFEGHKESMFNCRSQIYLSANRAFFDEMLIMFLAAARKTFSNLKKIVVFSTYFPVPF